jgi:ParB family transcriptional regulator, chromosome partitioning protein
MTEQNNKWPADKVQRRSISDLVPYSNNSRTHSDKQIDQIAASIKEWGWTIPILIDEQNGIIAGHARVKAAQKLKIKDAPCIVAAGWSKAQRKAYVIADNKLAENADWDEGLLALELEDLTEFGFEIDLLGFDHGELIELFSDESIEQNSTSKEIDPSSFNFKRQCPRCGFEFEAE